MSSSTASAPTIDPTASNIAINRPDRWRGVMTFSVSRNRPAAAASRPHKRSALARYSGAASAAISATNSTATSGTVMGVCHCTAAGSRSHVTAATPRATISISSTVVTVKGPSASSGCSKGDTAATSRTPADADHDPTWARPIDTAGTGITATFDIYL